MFILRLFHFLLGYVRFTAEGGFPERFINLCSRYKIPLWDVKSRKGVLFANTAIKGYKSIRPAARKSGMKVRVYHRYGLPFFMSKYRKRVGLLCGLAVFFIVIAFLSTLIWTVDVEGNSKIQAETIQAVFEDLGVKPGVRAKSIDVSKVERLALERLDGLSWLSLNLKGSSATIEVRESFAAPDLTKDKTPCNIVASRDGQIVILEAYEGAAAQKIGTAVLKGELLIGGATENKDLTVTFRHADGYIVARTQREFSTQSLLKREIRKYVRVKNHYTLNFLGIKIPLGPNKAPKGNYEYYMSERWIDAKGIKLPISVICREYACYETETVTNTKEEAKLFALEKYNEAVAASLKCTEILDQSVSVKDTKEGCRIKGNYMCLENIGEHKKLVVEQSEDPKAK